MSDFLMSSSFLNSLEEGVLLLDAQLGILANNEAASAMLQRESRELVGRPCPSLFPAMPCAHHCRTSGLCTLTPDDGEERKIQDVLIKNADGRERALRVWAMRVPHNAAGVHCTIILRDCSRERELEAEVREHWQLGGLTGRSVQMQDLYQKILRAAASDASVLISGESGVGKELAARALHDNSPRAGRPLRRRPLRRPARDAVGNRAVRPFARRLLRRPDGPHRALRGGPRRHPVPR